MANALTASADGTQGLPITVKAANPGQAELQWGSTSGFVEGFKARGKAWAWAWACVGVCVASGAGDDGVGNVPRMSRLENWAGHLHLLVAI